MCLFQPKHQQGYWSLNYPPYSPTLLFDLKMSYSSESHRTLLTIFKVIAFNLSQISQPFCIAPSILFYCCIKVQLNLISFSAVSLLCYFARVLMTPYFINLGVSHPSASFLIFAQDIYLLEDNFKVHLWTYSRLNSS